MADTYTSFAELSASESEGRDFRVVARHRTPLVVLAPHGGGIEPGTSEIAEEIAGDDQSLYLFEGLKAGGNSDLHITSHRFDEPRCFELLERAESALAIHGCRDRPGSASLVFVGGLDFGLRDALVESLTAADFLAEVDKALPGTERSNVCNRTRPRGGAQLEIVERLRSQMFESLERAGRRLKLDTFFDFCNVVRKSFLS